MDMYKLKWTGLQYRIFRILCIKAGQSLNLRGLARSLKVSPTAVSNSLKELEKMKFVKVTKSKTMNLMSIELNRDNQKVIELKRVENLKLIYESGLTSYLEEKFHGCTVVLFGSYSRGEDVYATEKDGHKSDIDIAIIGTSGKSLDLTQFDKDLERSIFINFYKNWGIDKNLKSNILNGIVLSGSISL